MANKVPPTPPLGTPPFQSSVAAISEGLANLHRALFSIFAEFAQRVNGSLPMDGSEAMTGPLVLPSYLKTTLPDAASYTGGLIYVTNESGGAVPAYSDGVAWRRVNDKAVVS